jgi:hypothetical protein
MMCKVFKVRKSSYYQWLRNGPSKRWQENEKLLTEIMDIFEDTVGLQNCRSSKQSELNGLKN